MRFLDVTIASLNEVLTKWCAIVKTIKNVVKENPVVDILINIIRN